MNIDDIRAAIRPAVLSDDFFEACRIMEKAAGIEEPFVARRFEQMASKIAMMWLVYEPADRAESLRYWLAVERMWPMLKIGKETPSTAADRRRPDHTVPCLAKPGLAGPDPALPSQAVPYPALPEPDYAGQAQMVAPLSKINAKEISQVPG